ncbi:protein kinase, partial [bacterium]|nr:protein kinase [bacterium]
MIGQTISHFKVLEKLGAGGMGEVYLAEDAELDRKVALKFLPTQYTSDPDAVERFKREAKAAASLNHPNIITVYEVGEHEGQTFIAMEHVKGESLRERMKKELQSTEAVELILQVCDGLSKAHHADIIHRDIKPENIMIDEDGRVRVLDFGLAKLRNVSKLTQTATTLGTLNYMSPEQLQGMDVDASTDTWSVGVVLYEMLTGKLPFSGDYEASLIYSILHDEPASIPTDDGLQRLDNLISKVLAKNPEERYSNISDLQADLHKIQKGVLPEASTTQFERREKTPFFKTILKRRVPHLGVDYTAPTGTPVWAAANGRVKFAGRKGPNGKLIVLRHP